MWNGLGEKRASAAWQDQRAMSNRSTSMKMAKHRINHEKRKRVASRFIAGLSGQTALSAASLGAEMETAKHQAREAHKEIRGLKTRLLRTLGEEVAAEHLEHRVSSAVVKDLHAQVAQLLSAQDDLRRRLREAEEELEASRRLNRTLIRERNSNATDASGSGCRKAPAPVA